MKIAESELILNPDGSIYHLNLKPENIADTIIFVGDQYRVEKISKHFDSIEFTTQKREFKTQTGHYKGKQLTVISTGIGTGNIDIVLNELDALVNINLQNRTVNKSLKQLKIVRIGTSGALQKNIPIDSFVMSNYSLGLDGLLHTYGGKSIFESEIENAFIKQTNWSNDKAKPYVNRASNQLIYQFNNSKVIQGFTVTAPGFYGPQGRVLRLAVQDAELNNKIAQFNHNGLQITNLEMETAAIYSLSELLGHNAISMNAIIANRANGTFSKNPDETIEKLIKFVLDKLVS